jgi:hypothetical protein
VWPLSPSYIKQQPRQGFILRFSGTPTEQIPDAVRALKPRFQASSTAIARCRGSLFVRNTPLPASSGLRRGH